MLTTGSKLFFGITGMALVASVVYVLGSADGNGELMGTWVLVALIAVSAFIGGMVTFFRDSDPNRAQLEAVSAADAEGVLGGAPQTSRSAWPAILGLGAVLTAIGLVLDRRMFILGLVVMVVATVEWMVQGWADRLSGDPAYNAAVRGKLMRPFEFPVVGVLIGAFVVIGFSRIMLAASKVGAIVVFSVVAAAVFVCAIIVSTRPRIGKPLTASLLAVGGVGVLAAGISGAAAGERHFHVEAECEEDFATRTVSSKSAVVATITIDGEQADVTDVAMPSNNPLSLIFVNENETPEPIVIVSEGGAVVAETCPIGEGRSQYVTIDASRGVYHYGTEEHPDLGTLRVL